MEGSKELPSIYSLTFHEVISSRELSPQVPTFLILPC